MKVEKLIRRSDLTVNIEARAAFIHAQAACATAEIAAMQAANQQRAAEGNSPAYGEDAFMAVQSRYMIGHNDVIDYLRD
jgi:hypothetical protein